MKLTDKEMNLILEYRKAFLEHNQVFNETHTNCCENCNECKYKDKERYTKCETLPELYEKVKNTEKNLEHYWRNEVK